MIREYFMASGMCGNQKVTRGKLKDARLLRKRMTPAESVLWDRLRDRQCGGYKFRRQQIIKGYVADFFCEQAQIVIELDGSVHDSDDARHYDEHRENVFASCGIKTIRFKNDLVEADIEGVIRTIAELCRLNLKPSKLTEWECKRIQSLVPKNIGPLSLPERHQR